MRLIDADKLYPDRLTKTGELAISQSQIADAPTVEPPEWQYDFAKKLFEKVRPKGEWIDHSADEGYVECPICGHLTNCEGNIDELHYCWNCGAEMRGGKNETN